jgi:type II secretory pathway component PulJ
MGGLEDRIRRLENESSRAGTPSWHEYQAAKNRQWVRTLLSAFSRMEGYKGRPTLSEDNRALIEGDTEERRKPDRDIIVRYEDAHGVRYDRDALAEKARLRLREVGHTEDR